MQLINIHIIEATLVLQTGLHIGGGDSEIHIGGIDNEVIKHPVSGEPYIPGSSLKGKIRSLLEWKSGAVQEAPLGKKEYDNTQNEQQAAAIKQILQLFGISGDTLTTGDVVRGDLEIPAAVVARAGEALPPALQLRAGMQHDIAGLVPRGQPSAEQHPVREA